MLQTPHTAAVTTSHQRMAGTSAHLGGCSVSVVQPSCKHALPIYRRQKDARNLLALPLCSPLLSTKYSPAAVAASNSCNPTSKSIARGDKPLVPPLLLRTLPCCCPVSAAAAAGSQLPPWLGGAAPPLLLAGLLL